MFKFSFVTSWAGWKKSTQDGGRLIAALASQPSWPAIDGAPGPHLKMGRILKWAVFQMGRILKWSEF